MCSFLEAKSISAYRRWCSQQASAGIFTGSNSWGETVSKPFNTQANINICNTLNAKFFCFVLFFPRMLKKVWQCCIEQVDFRLWGYDNLRVLHYNYKIRETVTKSFKLWIFQENQEFLADISSDGTFCQHGQSMRYRAHSAARVTIYSPDLCLQRT